MDLECSICGVLANVANNGAGEDVDDRVEWPNASVRADGLFFTVNCPNYGIREQRISFRNNVD
jgi:hypothetical protein